MSDKILEKVILQTKELGLSGSITSDEFKCVEEYLNIKLSQDFKKLCSYCSYEFFSTFDTLNFGNNKNGGVIRETLYYRKKEGLPNNYLVLSNDDTYFLLLKTISKQASEVIWCDYEDFFHLCAGENMKYNPTIFYSFTDFYIYLLKEEKKTKHKNQEG